MSRTQGARSYSQKSRKRSGAQVSTTAGPRVTRRVSRRPASASLHWWTLNKIIAR
ncbi:hypothetical protein OG311_32300 [Streptomyces sp. NBC_01343]|uniref:hypothetical protein n=1 Tax=Streptomyces sp. NBC_01343 TaxID=2903832 RepID=UPI002E133379|nr:hypothetical protein OG311_32300 [Streptomyces sp. NBC_01343]